jgi:anti-sigma factor RsiW
VKLRRPWFVRSPRPRSSHDITCREIVSLVTSYLDGVLSRGDSERFERHLSECPHCREHLKQIEATIIVTGQVRPEEVDPRAREDLRDLYRKWLDGGRSS